MVYVKSQKDTKKRIIELFDINIDINNQIVFVIL